MFLNLKKYALIVASLLALSVQADPPLTIDSVDSVTAPGAKDSQAIFDDQTYAAIRDIALKIYRKFSPPQKAIVIGTDPKVIPFLTFLELRKPGSTFSMAPTQFHYNPFQPELGRGITFDHRPLEPTFVHSLFRHWDEFFPSPEEVGTKNLVLLGHEDDGSDLFAFHNYLLLYFKARHRQHNIVLLMMTAKDRARKVRLEAIRFKIPPSTEAIIFPLDPFPKLLNALETHTFDRFGIYAPFDITAQAYPRRNLAHQTLSNSLSQYMAQDPHANLTVNVTSCEETLTFPGQQ